MTDINLIGLIIAIVGTGIAIVASVLSLMYWVRGESNNLRAKAENDKNEWHKETREDRHEILNLIKAIESEMKDFHYKLLEIEKNRVRA